MNSIQTRKRHSLSFTLENNFFYTLFNFANSKYDLLTIMILITMDTPTCQSIRHVSAWLISSSEIIVTKLLPKNNPTETIQYYLFCFVLLNFLNKKNKELILHRLIFFSFWNELFSRFECIIMYIFYYNFIYTCLNLWQEDLIVMTTGDGLLFIQCPLDNNIWTTPLYSLISTKVKERGNPK